MTVAAEIEPRQILDADGTPLDVFSLPVDQLSLEALFRDLFETHWRDITFGPLIQGAAFELKADAPPTRVSVFDGYLTVAFGVPHFHICIGEHKGPPRAPTPPELARHRRTARADFTAASAAHAFRCRGAFVCSMARASSRLPCCYPIPSSIPTATGASSSRTGRVWRCGTSCGRDGSLFTIPIPWTAADWGRPS